MEMQAVRKVVFVSSVALAVLASLAACGRDETVANTADAGPREVAVSEAPTESETPPASKGDEAKESTLLACGTCMKDECGEGIRACVDSEPCRQTLQCVATECVADGVDLACAIGCSAGDMGTALQILGIFQCVTQTCGEDCGELLETLLGLLGGGGIAGGDGGLKIPASFVRSFSARPERTFGLAAQE